MPASCPSLSRLTTAGLTLLALAATSTAGPDTVWVRTMEGTGNGDDAVRALASSPDGSTVALIENRYADSTSAIITAKYSTTGGLLWSRRYVGAGHVVPVDVAVAADGTVIVVGSYRRPDRWYDMVAVKYSSDGDSLWTALFDGAGYNDDPSAVMVDSVGGVYVVGSSETEDDYEDMALVCYSAQGQRRWYRLFDFQHNEDFALGGIVDPAGYIYTVGTVCNWDAGGDLDMQVLKYDGEGALVWSRTLRGPGENDDSLVAAVLDGAGNLLVAGCTHRTRYRGGHVVAKLTPQGDSLWAATHEGEGDYVGAVGVDADRGGNVVVAANYQDDGGLVVKYAASGAELWRRATRPGRDSLVGIAVDEQGSIYVGGTLVLAQSHPYSDEVAVLKLTPTGDTVWVGRWVPPRPGWPRGATALAPAGNDVVIGGWCGFSESYRDTNGLVVRFSGNGNVEWSERIGGPGRSWDQTSAVCFDGAGNVIVAGHLDMTGAARDLAVARYSPDGELAWLRTYGNVACGDDVATAVATDAWQNIYVTGFSEGKGSGYDYLTLKYGSDGGRRWVQRYDGPGHGEDSAVGLAVDRSGNVVVAGRSHGAGTGQDYATVRYTTSGRAVWERRHNGRSDTTDFATGVVVDGAGAAYVTGQTNEGTSANPATTLKYDAAGSVVWQRSVPTGKALWDLTPLAPMLGPASDVYLAGIGAVPYFRVRMTSAGDSVWFWFPDSPPGGYAWAAYDSDLDSAGRLWVAGGIPDSALVVCFDPDGLPLWRRADYRMSPMAIVAGPSGQAYTTGRVPSPGFDIVTTGYDSLGNAGWADTFGMAGHAYGSGVDADLWQGRRLAVAAVSGPNSARTCWLTILYEPLIGIGEAHSARILPPPMSARPNPFEEILKFEVTLAEPGRFRVHINDRAGRLVRVLHSYLPTPGQRILIWDGLDSSGQALPAGIYFARLVVAASSQSNTTSPSAFGSIKVVRSR